MIKQNSRKKNLRGWGGIIVLALCLGLLLGGGTQSLAGSSEKVNQLKNSGFENSIYKFGTDHIIQHWSKYWFPHWGTGDGRTGKYSVMIINNSGKTTPYNNFDGVKQDFVKPLSKEGYTMSCWLRANSGKLAIVMGMSDGNFDVPGSSKTITIDSEWKKYQYSDVTSPARVFIRLNGQAGTFYIDDCSIIKIGGVKPEASGDTGTKTAAPKNQAVAKNNKPAKTKTKAKKVNQDYMTPD